MPELYQKHLIDKYEARLLGLYGSGKFERREDDNAISFVMKNDDTLIFRIEKNNIHRQVLSVEFNEKVIPAAFNYQKKLLVKNCPLEYSPVNDAIQNMLNFEAIKRVKKQEILVRCLQALNTYITLTQQTIQVGDATISYIPGGRKLPYHMLCKEAKRLHHRRMKPLAIALMALGILCAVAAICIAAMNIGFIISGIFAPLSPILFGASAGLGVVGVGLFAKGAYNFRQINKIPGKTQDDLELIKNRILNPLK